MRGGRGEGGEGGFLAWTIRLLTITLLKRLNLAPPIW